MPIQSNLIRHVNYGLVCKPRTVQYVPKCYEVMHASQLQSLRTWTIGDACALDLAKGRQLTGEVEPVIRDDPGGVVVLGKHTKAHRIGLVDFQHSRAARVRWCSRLARNKLKAALQCKQRRGTVRSRSCHRRYRTPSSHSNNPDTQNGYPKPVHCRCHCSLLLSIQCCARWLQQQTTLQV